MTRGADGGPVRPLWIGSALAAVLSMVGPVDLSADSVRITVPASVSFAVTDVSASKVGTPNPSTVSFDSAVLVPGRQLRISVKADGNFIPPGGPAIPANRVSWVTSSPVNGTGANNTLSRTVYRLLFLSTPLVTSGSVNVVWTLAAPGTPLRAGTHTLILRWRLESI